MLKAHRKIYKTLFFGILLYYFVFSGSAGAILNPTHDASNGINCDSCHFDFSNTPAWWNTAPANLDDVPVNRVCWQSGCHDGTVNPFIKTHSSEAMGSNKYGVFTFECINCHNPHVQRQVYHIEYPAGLTGTITGVDVPTQTFILDISLPDRTGDADPTDDYVGWTIVPHIPYKTINYKIASNTATTVTVTGAIDTNRVFPGTSPFGILVGRYLKAYMPTPIGQKTVKFFVSEGANSFADGDATREGVCEVCHTRTENPSTNAARHRNNAHDDTHFEGQDCTQCHAHTGGFKPGGTGQGHETHLNEAYGPGIDCVDCHGSCSPPEFRNDADTACENLTVTDKCNNCHSPDGAFDGVNSSGASIGAKDNWPDGVYTGSNLTAGKEKWCVGCHDQGTSVISGVQAPDIAGDNIQYGFYVASGGHGDPSLSAVTECGACHDLTRAHIDGDDQSYSAQSYKVGYRLKDVGGNDPMNIPYMPGTQCVTFNPTDYALCFSCHAEQDIMNDTRSGGTYCGSNPYVNAASINTTFKDVNGISDENIHADHLLGITGWQFIPPFPTAKWDSDRDGTPDNAITCPSCHNPHGAKRVGSDTPTLKMTVPDLDIQHGSDATGDYGQVGPSGNINTICFNCHAPNGGKYYYSTKPTLISVTIADINDSDPTAAEVFYTNSPNVSVTFVVSGEPAEMICAQDSGYSVNLQPDNAGDGWGPYASSFTYPISGGEGGYIIYCKLRNAKGESITRSMAMNLDTTDPTVGVNALTSPNGTEVWDQGTNHDITWSGVSDANLKASPIDLDYSTDSGGSYPNNITSAEANDGIYPWNPIPLIISSTVRVRLTATDKAGNQNSDESNADFTIQAVIPTIDSFTVSDSDNADPAAAEAGFTNGLTVDVAISASNFPVDMIIAEDSGFTQNSTGWIPYNTSTTYTLSDSDAAKTVWLKLRNASGESGASSYAIELDRGVPNVAADDLTIPNGAEIWEEGETTRQITWANGDITDSEGNLKASPIKLDYSVDSGTTYPYPIASGEANDGSYNWNPIPSTASYRTRVRITVTDKAGNQAADMSDADFLIKPPDDVIVTLADDSDDAMCGGGFDCSLREAIYNTAAGDTIWFNIPPGLLTNGVAVINILSALPDISINGVTIDGGSQAAMQGDSNPNGPEVRIDRTSSINGLVITGDDVTIRGLQITNFTSGYGIYINGGSNAVIEGNHIGFFSDSVTGYTQRGNDLGILASGSGGARIGGDETLDRNYVSGNYNQGIYLSSPNCTVENNFVGLLPDGASMRNGASDPAIYVTANNSVIQDNMISGGVFGIDIGSMDTLSIKGNIFGLYYDGANWFSRSQQTNAIRIRSTSIKNITIGGPNVATDDDNLNDSNVISSSSSSGAAIYLYSNNTGFPAEIYGNFIGTNPEQDEVFTGRMGIWLRDTWSDNTVIGGNGAGEAGNVIANLSAMGVYLGDLSGNKADQVRISRNSFYNNYIAGDQDDDAIYLQFNANNAITRPTISSADTSTVTVGGVASGDTVEVYISDCVLYGDCADSAIYGEGMTFVGSAVSGGASVDVPVAGVNVGEWVTAIRIDSSNNTSEFSANFQVP